MHNPPPKKPTDSRNCPVHRFFFFPPQIRAELFTAYAFISVEIGKPTGNQTDTKNQSNPNSNFRRGRGGDWDSSSFSIRKKKKGLRNENGDLSHHMP